MPPSLRTQKAHTADAPAIARVRTIGRLIAQVSFVSLLSFSLALGAASAVAQEQGSACVALCRVSKDKCMQDNSQLSWAQLALVLSSSGQTSYRGNDNHGDSADLVRQQQDRRTLEKDYAFDVQQQCDKAAMQCKQDCATPPSPAAPAAP